MKKIYFFVLPLFLLAGLSHAQSFSWVNVAGNSTFIDYGLGVTVDNNHHVIATGMHFDAGTFGSTTLSPYGIQDAYVAKYDSTGALMWVKGIGGGEQDWGYAVTTDASDNIYVTGTYAWYALHFTATDSLPISAAQATNVFIAKYDPNGNFLWARNGGCSYSKSTSVTTDASGNAIISGFFNSSIVFSSTTLSGGGSNLFLVKYSPTGNLVWAKAGVSNSLCATNALKCDASGNIYATGKISTDITFGSSTFTHLGGDDMYTAKFDANGTVQWLKLEGKSLLASTTGNNFDCGNGLDVDNAGNVYVCGSLLDTFINATFYQSLAVVKYNNSGTKQWLYKYNNNNGIDVCNSLSLDAAGNPIVIGTYQGTLTIGTSVLPNATDQDIFIAKFNSSGTCISSMGIGTGNGDDNGNGICVDRNGSFIAITGTMRQTLTFGTVTATGDNAGTIFVAKMVGSALNGISSLSETVNFSLYPNPSNGVINLQLYAAGDYSVDVYNSTGQLIFSKQTKEQFNSIDLTEFSSGTYFVSLTDNNGNRSTRKIVRE